MGREPAFLHSLQPSRGRWRENSETRCLSAEAPGCGPGDTAVDRGRAQRLKWDLFGPFTSCLSIFPNCLHRAISGCVIDSNLTLLTRRPCKIPGNGRGRCLRSWASARGCSHPLDNEHLGAVSPGGGRSYRRKCPAQTPSPPAPALPLSGRCYTSAGSKQVPQCCERSAQVLRSPLPSKAGPAVPQECACAKKPPSREKQTPAVRGTECAGARRPPPLQGRERVSTHLLPPTSSPPPLPGD